MGRKIVLAPGEFYHIYNRGTDKRNIFLANDDRNRFIKLLYLCNSSKPILVRDLNPGEIFNFNRGQTVVDIGAYCLMPNHFHLLIYEKQEGGISTFMKKLGTGYSMYFNLKYKRTGNLFEGPFKSVYVNHDEHLKYLFFYIHFNPLKSISANWVSHTLSKLKEAKSYLINYEHSSFPDYLSRSSRRPCHLVLNRNAFPKYFSTTSHFEDWLKDFSLLDRTEFTEDYPL